MHKRALEGDCKKENCKQVQQVPLPVTLLYQAGNDRILQPGPVGGGVALSLLYVNMRSTSKTLSKP